jgi:hypothetical protein
VFHAAGITAYLERLSNLNPNVNPDSSAHWQLSIGKGALASGNYGEAAARLDASTDESWETYFLRGGAHANTAAAQSPIWRQFAHIMTRLN